MLQATQKEDFVKHAVIAIAALDMMTFDVDGDADIGDGGQNRNETHHEIALKQYSKALQLMRQTKPLDEDEATRNRLLACLLTTCFENFHGSVPNAVAQAQVGTSLFNYWIDKEEQKGAKIKPRVSPRPDALESDLVSTFARMDLQ